MLFPKLHHCETHIRPVSTSCNKSHESRAHGCPQVMSRSDMATSCLTQFVTCKRFAQLLLFAHPQI